MKNYILILLLSLLLLLASCSPKPGNSDNTELIIGPSTKYSVAEIEAAMDCVKDKFTDFQDCTLVKLWYDEEVSDRRIKSYQTTDDEETEHTPNKNIILFLSDFKTGSRAEMTMLKNYTYSDWQWFVINNPDTGEWEVAGYGFG